MSSQIANHAVVKQYLREVMDLGDVQSAAIAGVIVSKAGEEPHLSSDRGRKVLSIRLEGIPFQFSEDGDSIRVHSMEFPAPLPPALRGRLSKDTSLDQIDRLLKTTDV